MINFQGSGKRIDDYDLPRIGALIGVGEDEIHAVLDVEASGSGFDGQGRVKMLYEPHRMYAETSGAARALAVEMGLAYKAWGEKPYPKDSYPRLMTALEIDQTAALKSCSWGLGQILGSNHEAAGYDTVQEMIAAFCADEANQLQGMVNFIKANHLDDDLRRHDWAAFARGYNGSQYAKHNYHSRLKAAYEKWSKIKDTQFPPPPAPERAPIPKLPRAMPVQPPVKSYSWLPWFKLW